MKDRDGVDIRVGDHLRWDTTIEGSWYEVLSLDAVRESGELRLEPQGEVYPRSGLGGCKVLPRDNKAAHERQLQELRDIRARADCAERERLLTNLKESHTRNSKLADANGELKTQNTELLAENATLRREIDALLRKRART